MGSPKNALDRVITSVPLNKTAGRVIGRGEHYEPKFGYGTLWHGDAPPELRAIPPGAKAFIGDIPGAKFGRFMVVGLAAEHYGVGARWVVRCSCGNYEIRKTKAIRNPKNHADCCRACRHVIFIKRRYAQLGAKDINEFTKEEGQ